MAEQRSCKPLTVVRSHPGPKPKTEKGVDRFCLPPYSISMNTKRWSKMELRTLQEKYPTGGAQAVMCHVKRTRKAISKKARKLKIKMNEKDRHLLNQKMGTNLSKEFSGNSSLNPNWKGGISRNNYRYKLRMKAKYPEKFKCRAICTQAVRSGKLFKQPCEVCGNQKSEAHHEDYDKPLDVIWLCRLHHREYDRERRLQNARE